MPDHSAQQTYASANGGYFDRLECLADPWSCLPNYQQNTTQARAVLQRVLDGRLIFTPDGNGYTFMGETRFDRLFTGIVAPPPPWIKEGDVRGTEHITARTHV